MVSPSDFSSLMARTFAPPAIPPIRLSLGYDDCLRALSGSCDEAREGGRRSGCRLVSGSFSTRRSGGRERRHQPALRRLGEQPERTVEARLAAAVRAGDDVRPLERNDEPALWSHVLAHPRILPRCVTTLPIPNYLAPRRSSDGASAGHLR